MEKIKVSAKTLDDAIIKAQIQLNTTYDNMQYNVIAQGTNGLFGIGAKPWIIEASLKEQRSDFSELREIANEIREISSKTDKTPARDAAQPEKKPAQPKDKRSAAETQKTAPEQPEQKTAETAPRETKQEAQEAALATAEDTKAGEDAGARSTRYNRAERHERSRGGRGEYRARKSDTRREGRYTAQERTEGAERADAQPSAEASEKHERVRVVKPVTAEEAKQAQEQAEIFIKSVLDGMGMSVQMDAQFDFAENELALTLSGDDMGILIGKRGQTLDSLQYLTSLVVNKNNRDDYIRVKLDTENYRARREATLRSLAKNIAYKVKRTRKAVSLEPMNPYERRIIHAALQNDRFVTTRSEGEEPFRHVVIVLKR